MATRSLKFHLDESVPHFVAIAAGMRRHGIDVTTAHDAGLKGARDVEHLAFAQANERLLITNDADFLALCKAQADHPGVFYSPQGKHGIGQTIHLLNLYWECCEPAEFRGRVEYF